MLSGIFIRSKKKRVSLTKGATQLMIIMALSITLLLPLISGSVCCEKTTLGAWCQNEDQSLCDSSFNLAPTSCDSTSFCKVGCCYDSQEGLCMENTPQRVCEESNGTWSDEANCAITQCNLGCCILGDQAALSTLTRCKSLSGYYGIETDFRSDITDENVCIATANSQDKGACVYEDEVTASLTCEFITRGECDAPAGQIIDGENITDTSKKFYADILCTAEELGTLCAPSTDTAIIDGKDEIYFTDTCGNLANIYDADRYNDDLYWKNVYDKAESCGAGSNNAGSTSCGNCDYFLGSIGKEAGALDNPTYGDYICFDLSCEDREHGESWCLQDEGAGDGQDRVGSRFYRALCLHNEKIIEPCADFRNEICIENEEDFSEAACIVNRWQDCTDQEDEEDCTNLDARECKWVSDYYFSDVENQILQSKEDNSTPNGLCVPMYPPGFQFWGDSDATSSESSLSTTGSTILGFVTKSFNLIGNVITGKATDDEDTFGATDALAATEAVGTLSDTFSATDDDTTQFSATSEENNPFGTGAVETTSDDSSEGICGLGNAKITIKYEIKYKSEWDPTEWKKDEDCVENCDYVDEGEREKWAEEMNEICRSLGDCGGHSNWVGESTDDGYSAYYEYDRFAGSGGAEKLEEEDSSTTTGGVILSFLNDKYGGESDE